MARRPHKIHAPATGQEEGLTISFFGAMTVALCGRKVRAVGNPGLIDCEICLNKLKG